MKLSMSNQRRIECRSRQSWNQACRKLDCFDFHSICSTQKQTTWTKHSDLNHLETDFVL